MNQKSNFSIEKKLLTMRVLQFLEKAFQLLRNLQKKLMKSEETQKKKLQKPREMLKKEKKKLSLRLDHQEGS